MVKAGRKASLQGEDIGIFNAIRIYEAMLDAAPLPPASAASEPVDDSNMHSELSTETVDKPVHSVTNSAKKSPAPEGREAGGAGIWREHRAPAPSSLGGRIQFANVDDSAMAKDAARWKIVRETLPDDELLDIAVIVAAESGAFVGNTHMRTPDDLTDAAIAASNAKKSPEPQ